MASEKKIIKLNFRRDRGAKRMKAGDFWLTSLVMGLVVFGVIMVFSASYYYAISEYNNPYYYLFRSIMWAVIGTVAMLTLASLDYHLLDKFSWIIMGISLALLALLFTPVGHTINDATRWIDIGPITIMPGEIAKVACIIFVSSYLSKSAGRIRSLKEGILPMLVLMGVVVAMIYKQPNTSTAMTVAIIILGIMFVAGMRIVYLVGMGGLGLAGIVYLILSDTDGYRRKRIMSFLDPFADPQGDGYQVVQGLLAMGSGGLFGVGLGNSMQKTLYLPEPQNDFILAIIGEELGFIGLLLLLIVYIVLIWRCVHISMNAPDAFGTLMASGITIMLAVQVILNIMVVTSMMPPTGIILPFVSWGGNALVLFMGSMGIMLNISRHSAK